MQSNDGNRHPVIDSLRALNMVLQRNRTRFAARFGVTVADTMVISQLAGAPGGRLRPGVLAEQLGLGSGTVTAMLDRLEAAGLVARVANPEDRRSSLVQLQPKGRRALTGAVDELARVIDSALDTDQQAAFAGYLAVLIAAVDPAAASTTPV
jgi:DNA-binding MarR family transcriptional regulator